MLVNGANNTTYLSYPLAPAGTLVGLAKRALRGTPAVAVKTPEELASADALLNGESA